MPISYDSGSFAMREKGNNSLVPSTDYMMDALKLPNQAPRGSGESLQKCMAWRYPDGTQHIFCWPFLSDQIHSRTFLIDSPGLASPLFDQDRFPTIL
ncbi:hypothetical protein TNCV_2609261 [Trichonephila clavipes]|nr:hypothetical protein TNCV_2609261 [Trichonephila clavipes]